MMRPPPRSTLFPYPPLFRSQLHELWVHALDARFVHRLLPRLDDAGLDLGPALRDDFFDPPRVNAPVGSRSSASSPTGAFTRGDRKSTRLNSSHSQISYAVFC